MKKTHVYLKGSRDSYLNVLSFAPEEKPRAILHILHGMGEHAGRYETFAEFMVKAGYTVYAHDHRGHGKSVKPNQEVGILGKRDTFDHIIEDVDVVQNYIKQTHPKVPISMLGHSMGSIILRRYLQEYSPKIQKAIMMGTLPKYNLFYIKMMRFLACFLGLFKSNTKRHEMLANLLNDGLIKKMVHPETAFDWLTTDKTIVKAYIDSPLCGYAYNKRFYKQFFKAIDYVNKSKNILKTENVPLLFISGQNDPLNNQFVDIDKLVDTYRKIIEKADVTPMMIEGARHEVLNEVNKAKTYEALLEWLDQ